MTPVQAPDGQQDWVAPPAGSWSFDGPPNNHIVWSGPETRVCFLTSDGPSTKNAQLIAAAPDLLDALQSLRERLEECARLGLSAFEAYDSFYQELVDEAIARATGSDL